MLSDACQVKYLKDEKVSERVSLPRKAEKLSTKRISLKELLSSPEAKILSPSIPVAGEEQAYSKAQFKKMLAEEKEKLRIDYDIKISELSDFSL